MKYISLLILSAIGMVSCTSGSDTAVFRYFRYAGADKTYALPFDSVRQYQNPVLSGFYPDPAICRKGADYYLVVSSFAYYPGIPIFHSLDLVHWKQTGHVLNRPSQLNLDGIRLSGGVYAPAIAYNPHNDTFYLVNTCVGGIGNFVVKTKDPMQQNWSDPIVLPKVGGIDASIFFDDDGKAYIVNNDAPQGEPEWEGHRAIWIHRYDVAADSTSDAKVIVDGGTDKAKHPIWIEAPHLYKINGHYYLMCAEGGTGTQHSEVIFRSDNVMGTYIPWKNNPILTQRDLPADRPDPVTCAGHADWVQTPEGEWYAVFLACRPYEGEHFNTGRETFLLPVKWEDEYPVILPKGEPVPYVVEKTGIIPRNDVDKGNFSRYDDFSGNRLDDRWIFIRTPRSAWWSLTPGGLSLKPNGRSVYEQDNPAFIGSRQQHLCFEVQTELEYHPKTASNLAGLVCYQNEKYNFVFGKTLSAAGKACLALDEAKNGQVTRLAEVEILETRAPLTLKVVGNGARYSFYASLDEGASWKPVFEDADGKILSTQTAGGFTGVVIGMYVQ
ncbi:MAG: glycoside hydrolase family 43 protein [Dysgonamonadaceae bacterium]|jgi:alpha-N-arabinofuranosidase|nr:glycoside hydrolase family 43 protein [Dysgonamonadaceae bacterium]